MTKITAKDNTAKCNYTKSPDEMWRFYREQLITQSEHLAAQVKEFSKSQILHRKFHHAMNEVLYALADNKGLYNGDYPEDEPKLPEW